MIIHIKYVKPALTKRLTAQDCGGPQFVEAPVMGVHFSTWKLRLRTKNFKKT